MKVNVFDKASGALGSFGLPDGIDPGLISERVMVWAHCKGVDIWDGAYWEIECRQEAEIRLRNEKDKAKLWGLTVSQYSNIGQEIVSAVFKEWEKRGNGFTLEDIALCNLLDLCESVSGAIRREISKTYKWERV